MTEITEDDLPDHPESPAELTVMNIGLSALAEYIRMEGEDGELDRFALVETPEEEMRAKLAVALGVLKEKQDGAVLVDNQEENDLQWDDVLAEDGGWDIEAINERLEEDDE